MNDELRQPFEQLVQAYNQLPEAWTRRFERLDGVSEDALHLRHRSVNLTVELSPLPGIPLGCVPECSDPEHIIYIPVANFHASLHAPLEGIASPEEGIAALRTLQEREQTIHLNLPRFGGEQIAFGHYEGGVEYTYNIPQVRLEGRTNGVRHPYWHALPTLMHCFSFIPYNFNLDVNALEHDPETEEFRRQANEYLQGYETRNPTARIMGSGGGWLNFWAEDEETLRATSRDLEAIAESVRSQSRWQRREPFRITSTIRPRASKS
jgi:hypothetical protein